MHRLPSASRTMARSLLVCGLAICLQGAAAQTPPQPAARHASRDEARAMVQRALAHYKTVGRDKALADFSRPGGAFADRDLYVYTADMNGRCTSHGANAQLIGRDLRQLKDADGRQFFGQILDKARSGQGAWTDYKWIHPVSHEIEAKTTWCEPLDQQVFCVGAYR